jgi:hypothetical protein
MNSFSKLSDFVPPSNFDPKSASLIKDPLRYKKTNHTLGALDLLKKLKSAKISYN